MVLIASGKDIIKAVYTKMQQKFMRCSCKTSYFKTHEINGKMLGKKKKCLHFSQAHRIANEESR